jgi:hypothetical protein
VTDLETLLRRKQDELRGRPLNWRDHLWERLRWIDWGFALWVTLVWACAAIVVFVQIAGMIARYQ